MATRPYPATPGADEPAKIIDPGLRFGAFVALMAGLMALNALGIDSMLAALPNIGRALHVDDENRRQLVIVFYMMGFGVAQLAWGPLADAYGRRPIVIACTISYAVLSVVAGLAGSFELLLGARLLQGISAAASRVLVVSIVRDCYSGRTMARVMSLTLMVFLAVPILAPTIGQLIVSATGSWRMIFFALAAFAAVLTLICLMTLNETLHPEYRRPVSIATLRHGLARVFGSRTALGYTLAGAATFGGMMGFLNSVQQIFADRFHAANYFTTIFACCAASMAFAGFLNSRIVERLGSRKVSHAAVLLFIVSSIAHLTVALTGRETILTFALLQSVTMFCFGLLGSNFGAMAMESVGDIAGLASSVQGFLSTTLAAGIGYVIGQQFDGTTVPLTAGFTILGFVSLAMVLFAERGRLFRPHTGKAQA